MNYCRFAKSPLVQKINNKVKIVEDLLADWILYSWIEYMADTICVTLRAKNYINEL
jgi:hypothetical protein